MRLSYVIATPEVVSSPIAWVGWSPRILGEIADIGYEGVELQVRDPQLIDAAGLLNDLRGASLEVAGVSTGPVSSNDGLFVIHSDPDVRARALVRLRGAVELAADLGTHMTIGSVRGFTSFAPDLSTAMGWLRTALDNVLTLSEGLGVPVVLEPQSKQMSDLFNRVDETVSFIEAIGSPNLYLEADSYHMALEESSIPAALMLAHRSGRLIHIQVGDSNRLAPGWGHLNWSDFFGTLRALDYERWVSVEVSQIPDSRSAALQGHRLVTAILGSSPERPAP